MANSVVHFEVMGKNGPQLRSFYSGLFDWKFQEMTGGATGGMDYGVIAGSDGGIGGGIGSGGPNDPSWVTFYVRVDDIDACLDKAEALGGKTLAPKTVISNMVTFALFSDPEGHLIGLVEGS